MCMLLSNQNMPDLQRFERAGDKVQALYEYVYMMHQEINHVLSNLDEGNLGKSLKQTLNGLQSAKKQQTQDVQAGTGQEAAPEPEETEPALTLLDVYPIGSIYVSAENRNPASKLGGKWELVDKEFKQRTIESKDIFTINPDNVSSLDTVGCVLSGHTLALRIALKNKVRMADTTLQMGTINFAKVGVTRLSLTEYGAGLSDALNGVLYFTVNALTGVLNNADLIGSDETSTEETIHYRITQTIRGAYMLDEFCDRFFWKRTA